MNEQTLNAARQSVIGSMLISPEIVGDVVRRLSPEDFGSGALGSLYKGVCKLFSEGRPVDPVTLMAEVGEAYGPVIGEILNTTPTAANWEAYTAIVRDTVQLGKLQAAAMRIVSAADIDEARSSAEQLSLMLAKRSRLRIVPFIDGVCEFHARQSEHKAPQYLRWNFRPLDDNLFAEPGDLIILGGYPSAGKTMLAAQFAYEMAQTQRKRVGIFSLETSDKKLYDRMIAYAAEVDFGSIKSGRLSDGELKAVEALGARSDRIPLEVVEASGMTPMDIRAVSLSRRYLTIINTLLAEINYNDIWFDPRGTAVLQPRQEPSAERIAHTYTDGTPLSVLMPDSESELDIYDAPNVFICTVSNPDLEEPMTATAVNDNPTSALSTVRRRRRIPTVVQLDNIASQEELQRYAEHLAFESMLTSKTVTVTTLAEPGHGVGDVVAISRTELSGIYQETGWYLTLSGGQTMSHTLRQVVLI